jgi:membrane protease YdiL (CAAX protease family)
MIIAANAAVGKAWAHHAAGILCGLLAGALFLFGAIDYASGGGAASAVHNPAAVDFGIMVTALAAAAIASKPVRERAARFLPVDPDNPVHSMALALAVILFGTQASAIVFTDVFATEQQTAPLSIADLFAQELPYLVLALAGVGLWIRRDLMQSRVRLGFVTPAWWHVALALAAAGGFFAIGQGADYLSHLFTPSVAHEVDKTSQHVFGQLGDPAGVIALALLPGICEEAMFRGALQPRLGVVLSAVLFTAIHTEYGLSFDVPTIFVIAVGLGIIRKYTNTTTTAACHVAYNLLVGFGLTGAALYAGIGVEVILVAVVGYTLWSRRRRVRVDEEVVQQSGVR